MLTTEMKLKELLLHASSNENKAKDDMELANATTSLPQAKHFRAWFLQQFNSDDETTSDNCTLEDFAVYFLSAVRQQTEIHLRANESETPKVQTPVRTVKPMLSSTGKATGSESNAGLTPKRLSLGTPNSYSAIATKQNNQATEDFFNIDQIDLPLLPNIGSSHNRSLERGGFLNTSTPVRRHQIQNQHQQQHHQRRSAGNISQNNLSTSTTTPISNEKTPTRNNNSGALSSLCLGDFLVLNTSGSRHSNKKKTPQADISTGGKPKKRVVPTTISNRASAGASGTPTPFGSGSSSFSQENNILKISRTEIDDRNKCSIMQARKSLKLNASEISKELETTTKKTTAHDSSKLTDVTEAAFGELPPVIDLANIKNPCLLQRLADIYAFLIELNFTTNVLNEISFLLNLLNANDQPAILEAITEQTQTLQVETNLNINLSPNFINQTDYGLDVLQNPVNCIYFALRVIEQQRQLLALLDLKSLGVVLNNERITYLTEDLRTQLIEIYQQKQQLDAQKSLKDNSIRFDTSFRNVYFHEEQDSRQHFSSNNEFGAFKTQRDLFYKALKLWETNHLNPTWSFSAELTSKIFELFRQSENPINMAHFAKLFVSQLLISSSDTTSPEEIGIDGMDLQKFSKLTQRLVAPSNFSVDYQFPRNQSFFRDFISEARSLAFAEQLKMALYSELITRNDSTFEQLNFGSSNKDIDDDEDDADDANETSSDKRNEYIVRPEVLASMLILAKFLGFVTALPYIQQQQQQMSMAASVEKKQLMLRSLFQPHFNVCHLLQTSISRGKLLITLPWLVQYFAMLDQVTLQLDSFVEATQLIFALYTQLGIGGHMSPTSISSPTAVFIVRCCLGWLFETKPIIAEQYYAYRVAHTSTSSTMLQKNVDTMQEIRLLISSNLAPELTSAGSTPLYVTSIKPHETDGSFACVLQDRQLLGSKSKRQGSFSTIVGETRPTVQPPNKMLESTLNVACPFLAEFRVSIMPAKYAMAKYVSRTGRYRHITTRLAELPSSPNRRIAPDECQSTINNPGNPQATQRQQQSKLVEAFLHSQNSSMRRLIEFVIERTYKSVIKDAQHKILLPSKAAADSRVNEITSFAFNRVFNEVSGIYAEAREEALCQWYEQVSTWMDARIEQALDALLPSETVAIIKKTYFQLIRRNTNQKISQWRQDNMFKNNFYCFDLTEMTQKICKANKKVRQIALSSELKLVKQMPSTSDLIDDLQYWLHCTSMRPDLITHVEPIVEFVQLLPLSFENTLPTVFYRLLGAGLVQLLQHIIASHPSHLTVELIDAACDVWLSPEMQKAIGNLTNPFKGCNDEVDAVVSENDVAAIAVPSIYDGLITIGFIASLDTRQICYKKFRELLITLIQKHVITVDFINVRFVPIFKEDWHPQILNEISNMLRTVAQETSAISGGGDNEDVDDGKSHLFMEVLADFSRDVDTDF